MLKMKKLKMKLALSTLGKNTLKKNWYDFVQNVCISQNMKLN